MKAIVQTRYGSPDTCTLEDVDDPVPTASTVPAKSEPRMRRVGARSPKPGASRARYGSPRMRCQSRAFSDAARMRTVTSSEVGTGSSTSSSVQVSGDPYLVCTIAFMAPPYVVRPEWLTM